MSDLNELNNLEDNEPQGMNEGSEKNPYPLHPSFSKCVEVVSISLGDGVTKGIGKLPLFLGRDKKDPDLFRLAFGHELPFKLTKRECFYLIGGLQAGLAEALGEDNKDMEKLHKAQSIHVNLGKGVHKGDYSDVDSSMMDEINKLISGDDDNEQENQEKVDDGNMGLDTTNNLENSEETKGRSSKSSSKRESPGKSTNNKSTVKDDKIKEDTKKNQEEETKKVLSDAESTQGGSSESKSNSDDEETEDLVAKMKNLRNKQEKDDLTDEEIEEIKEGIKDVEDILNSMSDEEKEEFQKEMLKEQRDNLYEQAKDLEKELLGEIIVEQPVEQNYEYFSKIYENEGKAALKEEMAKLPKQHRSEIIEKIMAEYGSKNKV